MNLIRYISSLHAKDVGLFKELNIKFNRKFNFIVGPNASGKTSILRCIALSINRNAVRFSRYGQDSELWIDINYNDMKYRIGLGKGWVKGYDTYQGAILRKFILPPSGNGIESLTSRQIEEKGILFCPLIIGAYRKIDYKKLAGMKREESPLLKRNLINSNGILNLEGTFLPDVKQWMINRYFITEKEWANIEKFNLNWLKENMKFIGPGGSDFRFIRIKQDLEPIFSLNGVECYLEELSAGYQAILSLIFNIFDWIEGINDDDNFRIVKNAIGTVIIDELDIHMHPEWQFSVRNLLERLFPNLQFITTTHSPHLIATAKPFEIIILPEFSRFINVEPSSKIYSGWTTDQILEDIMGVKSLESKSYSKLYKKALKCIEQHDIEQLDEIISELKEISHPSDTIVKQLEIKRGTLLLEEK